MGYFQVRYDSRVVNNDRRGFIRLATGVVEGCNGTNRIFPITAATQQSAAQTHVKRTSCELA